MHIIESFIGTWIIILSTFLLHLKLAVFNFKIFLPFFDVFGLLDVKNRGVRLVPSFATARRWSSVCGNIFFRRVGSPSCIAGYADRHGNWIESDSFIRLFRLIRSIIGTSWRTWMTRWLDDQLLHMVLVIPRQWRRWAELCGISTLVRERGPTPGDSE